MSLREKLASYSHNAWSGWMRYMFSKCRTTPQGEIIIPAPLVERWTRQLNTDYDDLPEHERPSDRDEADKILAIVGSSSEV